LDCFDEPRIVAGRQRGGREIMRDNERDNECNSETKKKKSDLRNIK
jgi:hypothetical protein